MIDPREPRYEWGLSVVAAVDLYNDGSVPEVPDDQLLIVAGGPGEIVQIGHHAEANVPLYLVDFGLCVLGCLEEEIAPVGGSTPQARPAGGDDLRARPAGGDDLRDMPAAEVTA